MNKSLILLSFLFLMSVSTVSLADCSGGSSCQTSNFCGGQGSGSDCACTDPACNNNSCIDHATCCHVFGNIGEADETGDHLQQDDDSFYQDNN